MQCNVDGGTKGTVVLRGGYHWYQEVCCDYLENRSMVVGCCRV